MSSDVYRSKIHKIHFIKPQRKCCKIWFGHPIVLLSPTSHHTPSVLNWKQTQLNDTPTRRILLIEPAWHEASLEDIWNDLIVYRGKANLWITRTRIEEGTNPNHSNHQSSSEGKSFTEFYYDMCCKGIKIGR